MVIDKKLKELFDQDWFKDKLINNEFKPIYNYLSTTMPDSVSEFSYICIKSGLNPLIDTSFIYNYFLYYKSIKNFNIPNNIKEIGIHAFDNTELESVTFPDNLEIIGPGAFEQCPQLSISGIPDSVKEIRSSAFFECINLCNKLVLPRNLRRLGVNAFSGCFMTNLEINCPNLEELGKYCFSYCPELSKVNIEYGVKVIGEGCFEGCKNLTYIKLPSSLAEIHEYAFSNCKNLKEIDIPDDVSIIKSQAFNNCLDLKFICHSERIKKRLSNIGIDDKRIRII